METNHIPNENFRKNYKKRDADNIRESKEILLMTCDAKWSFY